MCSRSTVQNGMIFFPWKFHAAMFYVIVTDPTGYNMLHFLQCNICSVDNS